MTDIPHNNNNHQKCCRNMEKCSTRTMLMIALEVEKPRWLNLWRLYGKLYRNWQQWTEQRKNQLEKHTFQIKSQNQPLYMGLTIICITSTIRMRLDYFNFVRVYVLRFIPLISPFRIRFGEMKWVKKGVHIRTNWLAFDRNNVINLSVTLLRATNRFVICSRFTRPNKISASSFFSHHSHCVH